jgi:hypothetical protein
MTTVTVRPSPAGYVGLARVLSELVVTVAGARSINYFNRPERLTGLWSICVAPLGSADPHCRR